MGKAMDELVRKVCDHIRETDLIPEGSYVAAGVSGGADSMCLLYVLIGLQGLLHLRLAAVHVNHQVRGGEALEDQRYVEQICRDHDIPCRTFTGNVPEMAKERHLTEEEAGRIFRYACFEKARRQLGADLIAVAHNLDDVSETVLLNLVRGSGLKGLSGIPEKRGAVVRPLLTVRRSEIEAFDRRCGIAWRTDRTNLERDYARNRIRLDVLPYLNRYVNSRAAEHIAKAAAVSAQAAAYVERQAAQAAEKIVREIPGGLEIDADGFVQLDGALQRELLHQCIGRAAGRMKDIEAVHIEMTAGLFAGETGRAVDLPYHLQAQRSYGCVRIVKVQESREEAADISVETFPAAVCLPGIGTVRMRLFPYDKKAPVPQNMCTKWIDYDKMKHILILRKRRSGDYMMIAGHRKKLGRVLIDDRVPRNVRERAYYAADGDCIICMPGGRRLSSSYMVTEETQRILEIRLEPDPS